MKTRTLVAYWCIVPLLLAAYIITMATMNAGQKHDGPNAYASPNGNAWGLGHGKGKPTKIP